MGGFSISSDLVENCGCGRDVAVFEADRAECVACYLRRVKN
jgi:hypothetical protein